MTSGGDDRIDIQELLQRTLMTGPTGYYTDADGYTAIIKAYATESRGTRRHGDMLIRHPDGTTAQKGYWMDYPEKNWMYGKINLLEDYDNHYKNRTEHASVYRTKIPIEQRVRLEAYWQAVAYEPLKVQFRRAQEEPCRLEPPPSRGVGIELKELERLEKDGTPCPSAT